MRRRAIGWLLATAAAATVLAVTGTAGTVGAAGPTPEDAKAFIEKAEAQLLELGNRQQRAAWVQSTYITDDTEKIAAEANKDLIAATVDLATAATRFDGLELPEDVARKMKLLKLSLTLPAPKDPKAQTELTALAAWLEATYGKGKYCPPGKECLDLEALERIMAESRNPDELLEAWKGWHSIAPPMRPKYERFVTLANEGARTLGFPDMGALWRSNYDMPPDAFAAEVERLWQQVRPLYESLHAYVRRRLSEKYGPKVVPPDGPIPAHVLGNMWAQSWDNVYPLVAPEKSALGYDLTELLKKKKLDERGMVRYGERFFTSSGFEPLPQTFWDRSLFVKPRDRDVVCHASAWDVDNDLDLRIKMCIEITGEDFVVIHHELGHNFYQRAYRKQPYLFRNGANDGFHEAIGDAIALSVTPEYLVKVELLDKGPGSEGDIGLLLSRALEKVAFLPFGLLIDQWRWKVFSGEVKPAEYDKAWWDLRLKYQGIAPPVPRSEADFDPGAKYHVPANVPYTRYFLAHILQFQFHRALCRAAGVTGPLHLCSVYDDKEAGRRLAKMLEMGQSRPWPDALQALTGERRMDAGALLDYFAPLKQWLDEQNRGQKVGF
jgi:peptidyl-dipeptidase A